eukprot:g17461.t1
MAENPTTDLYWALATVFPGSLAKTKEQKAQKQTAFQDQFSSCNHSAGLDTGIGENEAKDRQKNDSLVINSRTKFFDQETQAEDAGNKARYQMPVPTPNSENSKCTDTTTGLVDKLKVDDVETTSKAATMVTQSKAGSTDGAVKLGQPANMLQQPLPMGGTAQATKEQLRRVCESATVRNQNNYLTELGRQNGVKQAKNGVKQAKALTSQEQNRRVEEYFNEAHQARQESVQERESRVALAIQLAEAERQRRIAENPTMSPYGAFIPPAVFQAHTQMQSQMQQAGHPMASMGMWPMAAVAAAQAAAQAQQQAAAAAAAASAAAQSSSSSSSTSGSDSQSAGASTTTTTTPTQAQVAAAQQQAQAQMAAISQMQNWAGLMNMQTMWQNMNLSMQQSAAAAAASTGVVSPQPMSRASSSTETSASPMSFGSHYQHAANASRMSKASSHDDEDDDAVCALAGKMSPGGSENPGYRRIRKNSREKQRRVELNELFEELSGVLEFEQNDNRKGSKMRKTCILTKAIKQLETLRKENQRLQDSSNQNNNNHHSSPLSVPSPASSCCSTMHSPTTSSATSSTASPMSPLSPTACSEPLSNFPTSPTNMMTSPKNADMSVRSSVKVEDHQSSSSSTSPMPKTSLPKSLAPQRIFPASTRRRAATFGGMDSTSDAFMSSSSASEGFCTPLSNPDAQMSLDPLDASFSLNTVFKVDPGFGLLSTRSSTQSKSQTNTVSENKGKRSRAKRALPRSESSSQLWSVQRTDTPLEDIMPLQLDDDPHSLGDVRMSRMVSMEDLSPTNLESHHFNDSNDWRAFF